MGKSRSDPQTDEQEQPGDYRSSRCPFLSPDTALTNPMCRMLFEMLFELKDNTSARKRIQGARESPL
jgi:hypothetical protein